MAGRRILLYNKIMLLVQFENSDKMISSNDTAAEKRGGAAVRKHLVHAAKIMINILKKAVFVVGIFTIYYMALKIWSSMKDEKELEDILEE